MEELPSRQIEANEKKAGPGTRRVCVLVRAMKLALHLKLNKHSFFLLVTMVGSPCTKLQVIDL